MPRISALPPASRAAQDDVLPLVDASEATTKGATVGLIMPTGSILDFAGANAPDGWLLCYGQTLNAVTNSDYQDLYDVIGNTYGGTSHSDFKVPDLRGRVVAGQDDMGGTSADRLTNPTGSTTGGIDGDVLGGTGGSETHTITTAQLASHTHPNRWRVNFPRGTGSLATNDLGGDAILVSDAMPGGDTSSGYDAAGNPTVGTAAGGGTAHNNVQPTIILNKIIKY